MGRGTDPLDVLDLAYRWADRCDPPYDRSDIKRIVSDLSRKDAGRLDAPVQRSQGPWPDMGEEAYYGIVGEFIRRIEPATEADPNALLVQTLAAAGCAFGRNPYFLVEETRHTTNLFVTVVGDTGDGRKGTGFNRIRAMLSVDVQKRIVKGLSSGEGLIHQVRDPVYKKEETKKKGVTTDEKEVLTDEGVQDKRLLVYESEFQSVLAHMKRDTNILSNVLRDAWDGGTLSTLTKHSQTRATGAHVCIVGNITKEELVASLTAVDSANGFANRFLWVMSRRSKLLPHGGVATDIGDLMGRLADAIAFAHQAERRFAFDGEAAAYWSDLYVGELSSGRKGLVGKVTSRAAPQVIRLALVYAVLEQSDSIRLPHLRAAVAVWRYCERSARYIFGDRTGNPTADRLLEAIRQQPRSLTDIHRLYGNHAGKDQLRSALQLLADQGLIRAERRQTGGRPSEVWTAA